MQLGLDSKLDYTDQHYYEPVYNTRRFSHTYVVGKTGYGKSTALINWALEDIDNGEGIAFFDPHGDAVDTILSHLPPERISDVVIVNPADRNYPVGINVLHGVDKTRIPFVASSIVDSVKSVWKLDEVSTPQLDQYLYNGIAALSEVPDGTLFGLKFLLTSKKYRREVLSFVQDPVIRDFWQKDFEDWMPEKEQRTTTLSTLNKIGQLIADPRIRNIIGQPKSTIDFGDVIDNSRILLVALPQGKLGIEKSSLLGALLMSQLHLAALARAGDGPFHIFADEAHRFGTSTLEELLSGIRKFNVSLTLAHQYLGQLPVRLQQAVIGTVGTLVSFRIGAMDARRLNPEFLMPEDDLALMSLRPYNAHIRVDNRIYQLLMPKVTYQEYAETPARATRASRERYALQRSQVDKRLKKFILNT